MRRHSFFLIFCLFLLADKALALDITFQKNVQVSADHILLGDIALFSEKSSLSSELSAQVVSSSPEPGQAIILDGREVIREMLRKTNIPHSTRWLGAAAIDVERPGDEITATDIQNAIDRFIKKAAQRLPEAEISFTPKQPPHSFFVPKGKREIEAIPSDPDIIGSSTFTIIIRVDGKVRSNSTINGKLTAIAKVPVTREAIARGSQITPADIAMVKQDITPLKLPLLTRRDVLGKMARHALKKGSVVEARDIQQPPLVQKGQLVRILLNRGELHLTATGVARTAGIRNQTIRVQNLNSRKLIYCRVTAPGIVEVIL